jgi:hypothetical protein
LQLFNVRDCWIQLPIDMYGFRDVQEQFA